MSNKLKRCLFYLIPVYFFLLSCIIKVPSFLANDDSYIMSVLSGSITGTPFAETMYFNILLGHIIAFMYKLIPSIHWYALYILLTALLSHCIIFAYFYDRIIIDSSISKGLKLLITLISILFYLFTFIIFSFTLSASLLAAAAIIFLYRYNETKKLSFIFLSGVFICLSISTRLASGLIGLVFWGLSFIYLLIKNKFMFKRLFVYGFVILVFISSIFYIDFYAKSVLEPQGYSDLKQSRAVFVDYPLNINDENREEFNQTLKTQRWNSDLFSLAKLYFTMDERLNADSYSAFLKYRNVDYSLKNISANFTLFTNLFPILSSLISMLIFIMALHFALYHLKPLILKSHNKNIRAEKLYILFTSFFSIALFFVLLVIGRALIQSSYAIFLPSFTILLSGFKNDHIIISRDEKYNIPLGICVVLFSIASCFLIKSPLLSLSLIIPLIYIVIDCFALDKKLEHSLKLALIFTFCFILSFLFPYLNSYKKTYITSDSTELHDQLQIFHKENPDAFVVYDSFFGSDLRMFNPNQDISFTTFFGGTNIGSAAFNKQLSKNNIPYYAFNVKLFLKDNIYYATRKTIALERVQSLMNKRGLVGEFIPFKNYDSFSIYKFKESEKNE